MQILVSLLLILQFAKSPEALFPEPFSSNETNTTDGGSGSIHTSTTTVVTTVTDFDSTTGGTFPITTDGEQVVTDSDSTTGETFPITTDGEPTTTEPNNLTEQDTGVQSSYLGITIALVVVAVILLLVLVAVGIVVAVFLIKRSLRKSYDISKRNGKCALSIVLSVNCIETLNKS